MDFRTLALSLLGGQNPAQAVPPPDQRDGWMLPPGVWGPPGGAPLTENDYGVLVHWTPNAPQPTFWWDHSTPGQQELAGYNTNLRPQQYGLQEQLRAALAAQPSLLGGAFPLRGGFGQFNPAALLDPSQVEWPAGRYGP